jgi:hypothetical protein
MKARFFSASADGIMARMNADLLRIFFGVNEVIKSRQEPIASSEVW